MTLKRYDLGREYAGNTGSPAITEQAHGAYVRHDDHTALADEWKAEKGQLEQIAMAQTVTITELRAAKCDGNHGGPRCADPECWNDSPHAAEPVKEVSDEALDWLETEISAVDTRYRGDPSYDHDAYWMRDKALELLEQARKIFAPAPPVDGQAQQENHQ